MSLEKVTVLEFKDIFTGYKGTRYEITENRNAQCRFDLYCAFLSIADSVFSRNNQWAYVNAKDTK